jgi:rod shape-determining protein MreC
MKQYVKPYYKRSKINLKNDAISLFKNFETTLLLFLCVTLIIISKINADFSSKANEIAIKATAPITKIIAFPFNLTIDLLTNFHELTAAKSENKKLQEEIELLRASYFKTIEIINENRELKNALNFISDKSSSFKTAKIIANVDNVFNQIAYIDIGENRGVKEGQIVISRAFIIGRIDEVFADKSKLILISDAASKIPVIASKSRVRGILSGNGGGLMKILYLPKNHNIEVGETIFTSGDGDVLPSGLFAGIVASVSEDEVLVAMVQDIAFANIVTVVGY